ncbi:YndM family protein [Radiobacillus sp. PE A8.2]|uniref:YndM family protein n=1 Tax=Radiobacillus sp. PE A8.2 TaxID=3380349 RepID=UPI00388D8451
MKHIKAFLLKFLVIAITLLSILAIFNHASITNIIIMSVLVTGVSYVIGDLFILPKLGNLIATIADFGLSFIAVWILGGIVFDTGVVGIVSASLIAAILISCSEALFHIYMQNRVLKTDDDIYVVRNYTTRNLQTEFAEEDDSLDYIKLNKDANSDKE